MSDALAFIDEAIAALTHENVERIDCETGEVTTTDEISPLQRSIGEDLRWIDRTLGPRGSTVLHGLGVSIDQALIALIAAKEALEKPS